MTAKRAEPLIDIARLPKMSQSELHSLWAAHIGRNKPPQRRLLIRELAWFVQEQREGGFDASTRRLLRSAMRSAASSNEPEQPERDAKSDTAPPPAKRRRQPSTSPKLQAAVRLIREWRGTRHEVTVVEDGRAYRYRDKTYSSLTAIAGEITGTHQSGLRFFGLSKRPSSAAVKRDPQ